MSKEIIPGAYVLLSYDVYLAKDGRLIESTKKKKKVDDKEVEEDVPIVIKIGEKESSVFFEEYLIGVKENEEKEVEVPPEKAYGKRDPKKIRTVPLRVLRRMVSSREIRPGAILYDDKGNYIGVVRYVGSRDVLIDQNHPFADEKVKVKFKVHKVVLPTDPDIEKIGIILRKYLEEDYEKVSFKVEGGKAIISLNLTEIPLRTYLNRFCLTKLLISEEITRETSVNTVEFIERFSLTLEEVTPTVKSIEPSRQVEKIIQSEGEEKAETPEEQTS